MIRLAQKILNDTNQISLETNIFKLKIYERPK
ncbi:hypothetical protein SAMN05444395_1107 [Flavobacterium fryxellicola]|nr:hypothetical protein SAMN05444395_1107 [Flavobacterium fryxellicola]